jgi:hypothetical protein
MAGHLKPALSALHRHMGFPFGEAGLSQSPRRPQLLTHSGWRNAPNSSGPDTQRRSGDQFATAVRTAFAVSRRNDPPEVLTDGCHTLPTPDQANGTTAAVQTAMRIIPPPP